MKECEGRRGEEAKVGTEPGAEAERVSDMARAWTEGTRAVTRMVWWKYRGCARSSVVDAEWVWAESVWIWVKYAARKCVCSFISPSRCSACVGGAKWEEV